MRAFRQFICKPICFCYILHTRFDRERGLLFSMAYIYIDSAKTMHVLSNQDTLIRELNSLMDQVDSVRTNLRYKIACRATISARLQDTARQIGMEAQRSAHMRDAFNQIIALYQQVETKNLGLLQVENSKITKIAVVAGASSVVSSMDKVIADYEKDHPEQAKLFNEFLSGGKNNQLTDDDIRNIKYLAYSAKEPFRSIYLNSLSKFKIGNGDLNGGAYYKPFFHTLNYSYPDDFANDPRGPYTTIFHECGHAIDDLSEKSKWWGSDTENYSSYSNSLGKNITLREAIEYDVYYNPNNPHSITSIANQIISNGKTGSNGNINNVISAFQSGKTAGLSNADLSLYNAVRNQHQRTTAANESYEAVSDVYGGLSCNALRNGYGHDTAYWDDKNKAGQELWAEFFSYNMAGDEDSLQNLLEFFPEASQVLSAYANDLAG